MHLAHRNRQGNVPVWMAQMSLHCTQNEVRTPPCPIESRQDSCQLRVEPAGHLPSHTGHSEAPAQRPASLRLQPCADLFTAGWPCTHSSLSPLCRPVQTLRRSTCPSTLPCFLSSSECISLSQSEVDLCGPSLPVQRLRICLAMQGTWSGN